MRSSRLIVLRKIAEDLLKDPSLYFHIIWMRPNSREVRIRMTRLYPLRHGHNSSHHAARSRGFPVELRRGRRRFPYSDGADVARYRTQRFLGTRRARRKR